MVLVARGSAITSNGLVSVSAPTMSRTPDGPGGITGPERVPSSTTMFLSCLASGYRMSQTNRSEPARADTTESAGQSARLSFMALRIPAPIESAGVRSVSAGTESLV